MCRLLCKQPCTISKYLMTIKYIAVKNFGSVEYYEATLREGLNALETCYTSEISLAVELILCNKTISLSSTPGVRKETVIHAEVLLDNNVFGVEVTAENTRPEILVLRATDEQGNNVTAFYCHAISHCRENDSSEVFDGMDRSFSLKLCQYHNSDECDFNRFSDVTDRIIKTQAFRSYLIKYIKTFNPEPINTQKEYQISLTKRGRFEVIYPGASEKIPLSETEEKLFLYMCFLNTAEFWKQIENVRNMHHETKPLIIKNLLEFLDQSTKIHNLVMRTLRLKRQIIILTLPMSEETKKEWIGEINEQRNYPKHKKRDILLSDMLKG